MNVLEINQSPDSAAGSSSPYSPARGSRSREPRSDGPPGFPGKWSPGPACDGPFRSKHSKVHSKPPPQARRVGGGGLLSLLFPTLLLWALATYPLSRASLKPGPPPPEPSASTCSWGEVYEKGRWKGKFLDSFICWVGKGHLWAKYSPRSLPQPSLLQLIPKRLLCLNSLPSELGSTQAPGLHRWSC